MPMEMTGEFRIPAPRQRVWEGLNDPEILKQCIPGCQSLDKVSDTEFNGRVVAVVGPVRATFGGKVTLSDLDPPQSYTISGEGNGGVAGFAKGGAKVNLAEDGAATLLKYAVQAQVGGKLAQVGSRLIDGVARKMANDFFGRFADVMIPEQPPSAVAVAAPAAVNVLPSEQPAPTAPPMPPVAARAPVKPDASLSTLSPKPAGVRLPPAVWVTGLAVIIVLLLYFFAGHDTTH
jgi:carbon monoxide dehydrogenase subunit G